MNTSHSVREQIQYRCQASDPNRHQREMSFLRHLMLYDEGDERRGVEDKLISAERNERCAWRAMLLMGVLTALAIVCLGYAAVMLEDFPQNKSQLIIRIFGAFGLASLVSFIVFLGVWIVSRLAMDDQREACRTLITRIMESRLGKPNAVSSPHLVRATSDADAA